MRQPPHDMTPASCHAVVEAFIWGSAGLVHQLKTLEHGIVTKVLQFLLFADGPFQKLWHCRT